MQTTAMPRRRQDTNSGVVLHSNSSEPLIAAQTKKKKKTQISSTNSPNRRNKQIKNPKVCTCTVVYGWARNINHHQRQQLGQEIRPDLNNTKR
jgi:hypothetical protein